MSAEALLHNAQLFKCSCFNVQVVFIDMNRCAQGSESEDTKVGSDRADATSLATHTLSISVAIPVFNGAKYLPALLRSICAQTYPVREVVLSDDGSSDDSLAIAEQVLMAHGMRHQLLHRQAPSSVSGNYEFAIRHCDGDLIFLADQDDVWPPARCARYVEAFSDPRISLVAADSALADQKLNALGPRLWLLNGSTWEIFRRGTTRDDVLKILRSRMVAHQIAFRSRCVTTILQRPERFFIEDWASWAAELTGFCCLLDQPLTLYRQHDQQTTRLNGTQRPANASDHARTPAFLTSLRNQDHRLMGIQGVWVEALPGLPAAQRAQLQGKLSRLLIYRTSLLARIRLFDHLGDRPTLLRSLTLLVLAAMSNLRMGLVGIPLTSRDALRLFSLWQCRQRSTC